VSGTVRILVDGSPVRAEPGRMLLPLLRELGLAVPSLCHVDGLTATSACRLCLVEVDGGRGSRVVTSCDMPVIEGMKVTTTSERIERLRRSVMALHLARAPGSPEVRDLASRMGVELPPGMRTPDPADRCILCGLCARVCADVVGAHAITLAGRGRARRVTLPFEELASPECIGCGACAWICPTGCIEVEPLAIERLRSRWGDERPCRHALLGLLPGTVCPRDYRCADCEVDHQMFERAGGRHPAMLLVDARREGGGR